MVENYYNQGKLAEIRNGFARKVEEELQQRAVKLNNALALYNLDLSAKSDDEIDAILHTLKSVIGETVYDNQRQIDYTILMIFQLLVGILM